MGAAQKRWTPSELSILEIRRQEKVHPKLIAEELGRTFGAVMMRCQIDNGNRRRRIERMRETWGPIDPRVPLDDYIPPPPYVLRERSIRLSLVPSSITAALLADPVEGYSALANKARKLSVQDALEICALHDRNSYVLARRYGVSENTIKTIVNGSWFDRLLPKVEE